MWWGKLLQVEKLKLICTEWNNTDVWDMYVCDSDWMWILQIYTYCIYAYCTTVFHVYLVHWVCWKTCIKRVEISAFFHSKASKCTTTNHFRSCSPVCLPNCQYCHGRMCLIFFFPPLSCPCKMASTWLCHHHKAANHLACACMRCHAWRALVRIPMWGRISLAAQLILASFLLCGKLGERFSWAGGLHARLMVTKNHQ